MLDHHLPDVISYTVCSLAFMILISIYYARMMHLPILRSKFFKLLITFNITGLCLSIICGIFTWNPKAYPIFLIRGMSILYVFIACANTMLFFLYVMTSIGFYTHKNLKKCWLFYIPQFVMTILLLAIPFTNNSLFYVNPETHVFEHGPLYLLMYIIPGIYVITAALFGLFNNHFNAKRRTAYISYALAELIAISINIVYRLLRNKNIVLIPTAATIACAVLFISIELPNHYVDKISNTFYGKALKLYVEEALKEGIPISLLFIRFESYNELTENYNATIVSSFTRKFSSEIKKEFKPNPVFSNGSGTFIIVIKHKRLTDQMLELYINKFEKNLFSNGIQIKTNVKLCYLERNPYLTTLDGINNAIEAAHHYFAKSRYENHNTIYCPTESFYKKINQERRTERVLLDAVKNNTIEVYYQPIISAQHHLVKSCEALCRLKDPITEEYISPDLFVRIAEKNGLIHELGEQIFRRVVKFLATGKVQKLGVRHISINISMRQCQDATLADKFLAIVNEYKVNPDAIIIEITETEESSSITTIKQTINRFVENGFRIAIDDFGSGYANFSYIFDLPVNTVKIDKTVLYTAVNADPSEFKNSIFLTIVNLIKSLNLSSIVEGVETEEHKTYLENLGLYRHQGFFYSEALPEKEFLKYVKEYNKDGYEPPKEDNKSDQKLN